MAKHISLDTARKLKDAGLQWEPKIGDCFYDTSWTYIEKVKHVRKYIPECKLIYTWEYFEDYLRGEKASRLDKVSLKDTVFAPRLDQLLAEIKAQGWGYALYSDNTIEIEIETNEKSIPPHLWLKTFTADTPEEAVAQALLWILKQEELNKRK